MTDNTFCLTRVRFGIVALHQIITGDTTIK